MTKLCEHGRNVCFDCAYVTDAGKRAFDIVNSYAIFVPWDERIRSWVAVRLSDGGHDGVLYQSKRDAVRHQADEFQCAYFSYRGSPNGFGSRKEAQVWLDWHRAAYDSNIRTPDPDAAGGGVDLIMPTAEEQLFLQLDRLKGNN